MKNRFLLIVLLTALTGCALPIVEANAPRSVLLPLEGGWAGLELEEEASGTLVVSALYWRSPAEKAGLAVGDVLVSAAARPGHGERPEVDAKRLVALLSGMKPGEILRLEVRRPSQRVSLSIDQKEQEAPGNVQDAVQAFIDDVKGGEELTLAKRSDPKRTAIEIPLTSAPALLLEAREREAGLTSRTEPGLEGPPFMGVSFRAVKEIGFQNQQVQGIALDRVIKGMPAARAGFLVGDVIIDFDSQGLFAGDADPQAAAMTFLRTKQIGDTVTARVLRRTVEATLRTEDKAVRRLDREDLARLESLLDLSSGAEARLTVKRGWEELFLKLTLGSRPTAYKPGRVPTNAELFPAWAQQTDLFETYARAVVKAYGHEDRLADLLARYAADELSGDPSRLATFRYAHRNPFHLPAVSHEIVRRWEAAVGKNDPKFAELFLRAGELLDRPVTRQPLPFAPKKTHSLAEHAAHIESVFDVAKGWHDKAFAALTHEEVAFLRANLPLFLERFNETIYLVWPEMNEQERAVGQKAIRVVTLARKVDTRSLNQAGLVLSQLVEKGYRDQLIRDAKGVTQNFVKETPYGAIFFGGRGDTRHEKPMAFMLELDGNDDYRNASSASRGLGQPFSILIDVAGNDRYASWASPSLGSGLMGNGFLLDLSGDDTYLGTTVTQGTGILGTGVLYDASGNDSYISKEYGQGSAFWGIGLLIDGAGDDTYNGDLHNQGFAGTLAIAGLIDLAGDDAYLVTGEYSSTYGDAGIFQGWSQGCAMGIRPFYAPEVDSSGGIAFLIDGAGSDHYDGGEFSQGGGYYFGFGLLKDGGTGDDLYQGSRYAQGFNAHSALGAFIEEGGNDTYRSRHGVGQGSSWDLSCTYFYEGGGDDRYLTPGFALGTAANNSFTIFKEMGGNDTYAGNPSVTNNTYHGGGSFCFFWEAGGQDRYSGDGSTTANDRIFGGQNTLIFTDSGKGLKELLQDELFRDLMVFPKKNEPAGGTP